LQNCKKIFFRVYNVFKIAGKRNDYVPVISMACFVVI